MKKMIHSYKRIFLYAKKFEGQKNKIKLDFKNQQNPCEIGNYLPHFIFILSSDHWCHYISL